MHWFIIAFSIHSVFGAALAVPKILSSSNGPAGLISGASLKPVIERRTLATNYFTCYLYTRAVFGAGLTASDENMMLNSENLRNVKRGVFSNAGDGKARTRRQSGKPKLSDVKKDNSAGREIKPQCQPGR